MIVNEYLSSKNAEVELLKKRYIKATRKLPLTTILLVLAVAGLIFGATKVPQKTSDTISTDSFIKYERSSLGNAVINTLNNGIVADNELGYTEETKDGIKVISSKGETLLPVGSSNINITDKGVYFRDNNNIAYCFLKHGESYKDNYKDGVNEESDIESETEVSAESDTDNDADNGKENTVEKEASKEEVRIGQVILDEPCGNCIIADNSSLYLIKFSQNSHVYAYDLNGKNGKEVISEPVRSFAVIDNHIFYLNYDNVLIKQNKNGNKAYKIKNVDKFYLNGDMFIQNNDKVIKCNLNNENGEVLADGIDELLGVTDSSVYYLKDNKVNEKNISSGKESVFSQGNAFYEGVYKNNGKVIAVGEDM